jgi:hypothetical protein
VNSPPVAAISNVTDLLVNGMPHFCRARRPAQDEMHHSCLSSGLIEAQSSAGLARVLLNVIRVQISSAQHTCHPVSPKIVCHPGRSQSVPRDSSIHQSTGGPEESALLRSESRSRQCATYLGAVDYHSTGTQVFISCLSYEWPQ